MSFEWHGINRSIKGWKNRETFTKHRVFFYKKMTDGTLIWHGNYYWKSSKGTKISNDEILANLLTGKVKNAQLQPTIRKHTKERG